MNNEIDLSSKKCLPCEGGVDSINEQDAKKFMSKIHKDWILSCLLYTSPSPRDRTRSRMPSSA